MVDQDLSMSLTKLAEKAGRTGRLPAADDIRARGEAALSGCHLKVEK